MAGDRGELPEDVAGTLALRDNAPLRVLRSGAPGLRDSRRQAGRRARTFRIVCLFDQRGVHVALSHYCPTSTALLFEHSGPIEIVEGPSPIADLDDARRPRRARSPAACSPKLGSQARLTPNRG